MSGDGLRDRVGTAVSNLLIVIAFPAVLMASVLAGIGWLCWIAITLLGPIAMRWNGPVDVRTELMVAAAWSGASFGVIALGRLVTRRLPVASEGGSGALAFTITTGLCFLGLSLYAIG